LVLTSEFLATRFALRLWPARGRHRHCFLKNFPQPARLERRTVLLVL
jgi:hypothetical protein